MDKSLLKQIQAILAKYLDKSKHKPFIFGSRATGKNFKFSDIDIGVEGKEINPEVYFSIVSDFEESDIPYKVEIVDFNNVSENFKKIAKTKVIPINL